MSKPLTYHDLLQELQKATPEQLAQDITVHLTEVDEFVPVLALCVAVEDECDVLDAGCLVLGS